jgi:tRNA U34 5-methylaminomethyl-2-thiouridine-forming methyltransferase MnmC
MQDRGMLVTYSRKNAVRRNMKAAGFAVKRFQAHPVKVKW